MHCDEHGTLDYCPFCIQEDSDKPEEAKAVKFRINYTRSNGKRSLFDCTSNDEIGALVKLEKNRANYNESLSDLSSITIKLSPQK